MQETPQPPPFDVAACELMREQILHVLAKHPEVRSISVSLDYFGNLNDADIHRGVWIDRSGAVTAPDAIFGSLFQTLRMLDLQLHRAVELIEALRQAATHFGQQVVERAESATGREHGN